MITSFHISTKVAVPLPVGVAAPAAKALPEASLPTAEADFAHIFEVQDLFTTNSPDRATAPLTLDSMASAEEVDLAEAEGLATYLPAQVLTTGKILPKASGNGLPVDAPAPPVQVDQTLPSIVPGADQGVYGSLSMPPIAQSGARQIAEVELARGTKLASAAIVPVIATHRKTSGSTGAQPALPIAESALPQVQARASAAATDTTAAAGAAIDNLDPAGAILPDYERSKPATVKPRIASHPVPQTLDTTAPQIVVSVPSASVSPAASSSSALLTPTAPQILSKQEAPLDFEALIDRLAQARDFARPSEARLAVNHAEFGAVTIRFENAAPITSATGAGLGVAVTLRNADPDFSQAVQAALADRASGERNADRATDENNGARQDSGDSASYQARSGDRHDPDRRSAPRMHSDNSTSADSDPAIDAAAEQSATRQSGATGVARGLYI